MSTTKTNFEKKGIQVNKATGVIYIDIREIIESELERIRKKSPNTDVTEGDSHSPEPWVAQRTHSSKI